MKAKYFNWKNKIDEEELKRVVNILDNDGVIIFPTDTVYGIGCNCFSTKAIKKIFSCKNRPNNKPINVLTDNYEKILSVVKEIKPKEKELINKYMPGALTIILKKNEAISPLLTANLDTIGVRIPANSIALKILESVNYPLATTSANISGEESGIKLADFEVDFADKVDAIIDGGESKLKVASTIVQVDDKDNIKILRQGTLKIK